MATLYVKKFWIEGSTKKMFCFCFLKNISEIRGEGSEIPKLYVKFFVVIVFGLENLTFFWPKVTFEFLNVHGGGGTI